MRGQPVRSVVITVTNGQVEVSPDVVTISKKLQEGVEWYCPQGDASINFAKSPFESDHFLAPRGGGVITGHARETGTYKYSVIVRIPGDRREYVKDPEVVVEG